MFCPLPSCLVSDVISCARIVCSLLVCRLCYFRLLLTARTTNRVFRTCVSLSTVASSSSCSMLVFRCRTDMTFVHCVQFWSDFGTSRLSQMREVRYGAPRISLYIQLLSPLGLQCNEASASAQTHVSYVINYVEYLHMKMNMKNPVISTSCSSWRSFKTRYVAKWCLLWVSTIHVQFVHVVCTCRCFAL